VIYMSINFVTNYPVLFVSELRALVIADLHIGLEYDLYRSGVVIPSQVEKFTKILKKVIKMTKAKQLIILGDIKYKVPGSTIREDILIPKFLSELQKHVKIIIAQGNHDDQIEGILPEDVKLYSSRGFKIGKYGFFHGHAWPSKKLMECDYLFMGHIQPAVEFIDKFRHRAVQLVWLKGKVSPVAVKVKYKIKKTGQLNIIIFPTFNPLSGSLKVNAPADWASPLLTKEMSDIKKFKAYLLDGTYLGQIENLKRYASGRAQSFI